jgi:hypothetical protein
MSYALGQAKWIPGQIHFQTTPSGKLPSLRPLLEAGLPYAPYIEHGSYARGTPDIARYGRDPYRGLGQSVDQRADQMQQAVTETVTGTIQAALPPIVMVGTGVAVGSIAGSVGGLLGSTMLGGLLGAMGGGVIGFLAYKAVQSKVVVSQRENAGVAGLNGMLAVL